MPQPPAYARQFDFTQHEADSPSAPPPGVNLDAEFNAILATAAAILANLVKIQRDDGALKNAIVTLDSLSPAAIAALGAGSQWLPRGAWVTGTNYAVSDVITEGTATYVCGQAHVAAALFATDAAVAGRWIKIFDSQGAIPADGSVTAGKLAAGAVTAPAIGFNDLDLTGNIRGGTGLQAGTAALGGLLHAKAAAGAAHGKIERTTDDQGAVGYQIIGVGATWTLEQAADSNNLQLRKADTVSVTFNENGWIDAAGAVRAIAGAFPTSGDGVGLSFVGSIGYLTSFNYDTTAWRDLKLRGKDVYIDAAGVNVAKATSTEVNFLKQPKYNGQSLGFAGIPQYVDNDAHTIVTSENGGHIYSENVAGQTITLPAYNAVTFAPGTDWVLIIINDGSNPITLQGATAAVQLRLAGTATVGQSRTIAAGGWATIKCVKQNRYFVGGIGVS